MGTISYILREDTWGNGYATEAAQHVVDFAFGTAGRRGNRRAVPGVLIAQAVTGQLGHLLRRCPWL